MNKAIIPLYINSAVLNNLFTVVIQEFVEIKSISTKDSVMVHLKTPLSELSYDLFGKYVQGELDVQFQNEYVNQRTEESISTMIVVMKKLKDILLQQGLLKQFGGNIAPTALAANDFVEFPGRLKRNPVMENMNNCINMLEMSKTVNTRPDEITTDILYPSNNIGMQVNKDEMIGYLRRSLDCYKQERCLRYIAQSTTDENLSAIIPMKTSSFLDNEDYLLNGNVTILGKVVNTFDNENAYTDINDALTGGNFGPISNDAFFDYIDFTKLNEMNNPLLRSTPKLRNFSDIGIPNPLYEILPIAIYL